MSVDRSAEEYAEYRAQVEAILIGFDHEFCGECGRDLQHHRIEPDVLGNARATCLFQPGPGDM